MSEETEQRSGSEVTAVKAVIAAHNKAIEQNILPLWTIYDNPKDAPGKFIARMFEVGPFGDRPTGNAIVSEKVEELRRIFEDLMGLYKLPREMNDDPVIVETWL